MASFYQSYPSLKSQSEAYGSISSPHPGSSMVGGRLYQQSQSLQDLQELRASMGSPGSVSHNQLEPVDLSLTKRGSASSSSSSSRSSPASPHHHQRLRAGSPPLRRTPPAMPLQFPTVLAPLLQGPGSTPGVIPVLSSVMLQPLSVLYPSHLHLPHQSIMVSPVPGEDMQALATHRQGESQPSTLTLISAQTHPLDRQNTGTSSTFTSAALMRRTELAPSSPMKPSETCHDSHELLKPIKTEPRTDPSLDGHSEEVTSSVIAAPPVYSE
ncbi:hypothetical protein Z043_115257 [Scleropages formosus]|uniref:Uncharacterized protein n=1 Tax=Scleropages formosus TaxID=113540 RepID=A0A0P7UEJ6_SCLFO|nr:hypothetical protein Z043_115257 [Scleropages formosus]